MDHKSKTSNKCFLWLNVFLYGFYGSLVIGFDKDRSYSQQKFLPNHHVGKISWNPKLKIFQTTLYIWGTATEAVEAPKCGTWGTRLRHLTHFFEAIEAHVSGA